MPEKPSHRYAGMTVNERLFVAGLMDAFDRAAKDRNRNTMIAILMQVALPEQEAQKTSDVVLADPARYGY